MRWAIWQGRRRQQWLRAENCAYPIVVIHAWATVRWTTQCDSFIAALVSGRHTDDYNLLGM